MLHLGVGFDQENNEHRTEFGTDTKLNTIDYYIILVRSIGPLFSLIERVLSYSCFGDYLFLMVLLQYFQRERYYLFYRL